MRKMVKGLEISPAFEICQVIMFSFLMGLSAQARIPVFFSPVPITFQTLVLFLSIVFLRGKAFYSQSLYVLLCLVSPPAGLGPYVLGPTGGYIAGFLTTSLFLPYLFSKNTDYKRRFVFLLGIFSLAGVWIYFCGVVWLRFFLKVSFVEAVIIGVLPFLAGDLFKIITAAFIGRTILSFERQK